MIKQGEQGKGQFYLLEKELTLAERTASVDNYVFLAARGESCDERCTKEGTACQVSGLESLTQGNLLSQVSRHHMCQLPLVEGCGNLSPGSSADWCHYRSGNCDSATCAAKADTVCVCMCACVRACVCVCVCACVRGRTTLSGIAKHRDTSAYTHHPKE